MENRFYVYIYVRNQLDFGPPSPYYIGKGTRYRAYHGTKRIPIPKDKNRIFIPFKDLTEEQAFEKEKELIKRYGRKDLKNGILQNRSDGGEGFGNIVSEETKQLLREINTGEKNPNFGKPKSEEAKKKISQSMTGKKRSLESIQKQSDSMRGKTWKQKNKNLSPELKRKKAENLLKKFEDKEWYEEYKKKTYGQEANKKRTLSMKGRKLSEEHRQKLKVPKNWSEENKRKRSISLSEYRKNKIYINNGLVNKLISKDSVIPDTFQKGRMKTMYITDGFNNTTVKLTDTIPEGWFKGRTSEKKKKRLVLNNNLNTLERFM